MGADLLRGRCLCRAVAYEIAAPLVAASHCHCESCRRAHSAAFVSWATAAAASLRVTAGEDRIVRYTSSLGAHRSFCGTCGSPLFMRYDAEPSLAWVAFASLETPSPRLPDRHYSFEERAAWFPFEDALPRCVGKTTEPAG
jgi:hypothetical protein